MRSLFLVPFLFLVTAVSLRNQKEPLELSAEGDSEVHFASPDSSFRWGNTTYVNLNVGETILFENVEVELLNIKNRFNLIRVGNDTVKTAVSFRSPALFAGSLTLFVADNRHVASLSTTPQLHGLLTKDALIAMAPATEPLADRRDFAFPLSFTGGFIWRNNEESYFFSYMGADARSGKEAGLFPGVAIDVMNGRGLKKFAAVAMESGRVVWVDSRISGTSEPKAAVCIESGSTPGIYYIYRNLYNKNLMVSRQQQVLKGDPIGTIWGEGLMENLHLTVVRSDQPPTPENPDRNIINFYPQLLELYYGRQPVTTQFFNKGQIQFGKPSGQRGNVKNASAYEDYLGMGWILGEWNSTGKVEWVTQRQSGNVRLPALLFRGKRAECANPHPWYDYRISVRNGVYRIRACMGDCLLPTWQKIEFNGVPAGIITTEKGEFIWTSEKVIRVNDNKLIVRIHTGDQGQMAGISEIVFQQAAR